MTICAGMLNDEPDDQHGDDQVGIERFDKLEQRAAGAGYELQQVRTGYMLRRGTSSKHCGDLATVRSLLSEP
mgnify:CR=1 FL=1|jgi:hypothetical protein